MAWRRILSPRKPGPSGKTEPRAPAQPTDPAASGSPAESSAQRKTPRDPEQVRKLVRSLRERFISPEAQAYAEQEFDRLQAVEVARIFARQVAGVEVGKEPLAHDGEEFTAEEKDRARQILDAIKDRYSDDEGDNKDNQTVH